jgi:hypothetical protein
MPLDETKNKELRTGKGYKRGIGWEGAIPKTAREQLCLYRCGGSWGGLVVSGLTGPVTVAPSKKCYS